MLKDFTLSLELEPTENRVVQTAAIFWSHDVNTAKIYIELLRKGTPIILNKDVTVRVMMLFDDENKSEHIYTAKIEDELKGLVSITLEESMRMYVGQVTCGVYVDYQNEEKTDNGYFTFGMRRSLIDKDMPELQKLYVSDFEKALEKFKEIEKKIEQNDVVTHPELKEYTYTKKYIDENIQDLSNLKANKDEVLSKKETNKALDSKADKQKTETALNELERKKADQSFVDAQLSSIVSGAPKGTYKTLQALKEAYPNGTEGVFLVLENGHWYYYADGWKDGGVYQSTQIAKNSITRETIKDKNVSINKIDLSNNYLSSFDTEKGFIDVTNGNDRHSENRVRFIEKAKAEKSDEIILLDKKYKYNVFLYDLEGNYLSSKGIWENGNYKFQEECLFKLGIGYVDDSVVNNEDVKVGNIVKLSNEKISLINDKKIIQESLIDNRHISKQGLNVDNINFKTNSRFYDVVCKLGNLNVANGEDYLPHKKIMNTPKIKAKKNDTLRLINKNFLYNVFLYNEDGSFLSSKGVWETGDYVFNKDCLFRLTIKYKDNSFEINDNLYKISDILDFSGLKYPVLTEQDQLADNIIEKKHLNFEITGITSHLSGKDLATLGDSITARGWYQDLLQDLVNVQIKNHGLGGSTITKIEGYPVKSFVERMTELPDELDYLLIWGGVNDFGGLNTFGYGPGAELGTFDSRDSKNFYGALHTLLEYFIKKYKEQGTRIGFVVTTPISNKLGMHDKNSKGYYLTDYCKAVKEVCEFYSIPYLDFYNNSGINELNIDVMTSNFNETEADGLHPSRKWFEMKKYTLVDFLERI